MEFLLVIIGPELLAKILIESFILVENKYFHKFIVLKK